MQLKVFICSVVITICSFANTQTLTPNVLSAYSSDPVNSQPETLGSFFEFTPDTIAPTVPQAYLSSPRSCAVKSLHKKTLVNFAQPPSFITTRYYPSEHDTSTVKHSNSALNSTGSSDTTSTLPILLDVTVIDAQLSALEPLLLHYPIAQMTGFAKFKAQNIINQIIATLTAFATQADASVNVLYRVAKAHHFARNLDLGQQHQVLELEYINSALTLEPNNEKLNFLYATMIAESGGFKESLPFFDKAISSGMSIGYIGKAKSLLLNEAPIEQVQSCLYEYYLAEPNNTATLDYQRRLDSGSSFLWRDIEPTISSE